MLKSTLGFIISCCFLALAYSQPAPRTVTLEEIINQNIGTYALTEDNKFRLAAYAELKGRYAASVQTLSLNFGGLGYLNFYDKNCLLRTGNNQVFSLNRYAYDAPEAEVVNEKLSEMFENIILLGNHGAPMEKILFIDRFLARKNLEPFEKVFIRHILIKYGRYDAEKQMVLFHTDWLPKSARKQSGPGNDKLVKRHVTSLKIMLSENIIRGYYLETGGTVYVENVDRDVFYATGEEYLHNVSAFKLFAQKLFVQSVQYIAEEESRRLEKNAEDASVVTQMVTYDSEIENQDKYVPGKMRKAYYSGSNGADLSAVQPLYHQYSWISMMLVIMRSNNINIGDDYVIKYFIDEPYFDRIYERLTLEERKKVDMYKLKRATRAVAG